MPGAGSDHGLDPRHRRAYGRQITRPALLIAAVVATLAPSMLLGACGGGDSAADGGDGTTVVPPEPEPDPEPQPQPVEEPDAPVLAPGDAEALAASAANTWALGMSGNVDGEPSCSADGPSVALCEVPLAFELNPGNVQTCVLPVAVVATRGRTGAYQNPVSPYSSATIEQEDFELPSGGLGTYEYGDTAGCDQAQYESGY